MALCAVFFLSGASALMFETLWFRLAGLTFGNSVWASSLVLASFMAGMALGNWLAATRGNRIKFPVRFYALLEVVAGTTGLALVILFPFLTHWLKPWFRGVRHTLCSEFPEAFDLFSAHDYSRDVHGHDLAPAR